MFASSADDTHLAHGFREQLAADAATLDEYLAGATTGKIVVLAETA